MANAKIIQAEPVVALELSLTEAKYLRSVLQNYMGSEQDEPQQDYDIRMELFEEVSTIVSGVSHG